MATATFTNIDGDFSNTDAWSGGSGTSGVPANTDDVVIDRNGRAITTNVTAYSAIIANTCLIKGVGEVKGSNGEALTLQVDATAGAGTLTIEGRGEVVFSGDTKDIRNRSESLLRVVGGAHIAYEASNRGGIIFGSGATVTGAGKTAGRFAPPLTLESNGTAAGQIVIGSPGSKVTLKGRNASRVDALADGVVVRFEGTAKLTSTGSILGPSAVFQLAGSAANFDDILWLGTIDARELEANTQFDDSTIYEGARLIGSPAGYKVQINGEGSSNDSDVVGAPDVTSVFA